MTTTPTPAKSSWRLVLTTLSVVPLETLYRTILLGLAEPVTPSPEWVVLERRYRRRRSWAGEMVLLGALGLAVISLFAAWSSNASEDWLIYWTLVGTVCVISLVVFFAAWRADRRLAYVVRQRDAGIVLVDSVPALRHTILHGETSIASAATEQPYPTTSTPAPDVTRLRVFPPQRALLHTEISTSWSLMLIGVLYVALTVLPFFLFSGRSLYPWQITVMAPLILALGVGQRIALRRATRASTVTVDDHSIQWRVGRQQFAMDQKDIRGWSRCKLPQQAKTTLSLVARSPRGNAVERPRAAVYTVHGEHASFSWLVGTRPARRRRHVRRGRCKRLLLLAGRHTTRA